MNIQDMNSTMTAQFVSKPGVAQQPIEKLHTLVDASLLDSNSFLAAASLCRLALNFDPNPSTSCIAPQLVIRLSECFLPRQVLPLLCTDERAAQGLLHGTGHITLTLPKLHQISGVRKVPVWNKAEAGASHLKLVPFLWDKTLHT